MRLVWWILILSLIGGVILGNLNGVLPTAGINEDKNYQNSQKFYSCNQCHSATIKNYVKTSHGTANVSCVSCHQLKDGAVEDKLFFKVTREKCEQCHLV